MEMIILLSIELLFVLVNLRIFKHDILTLSTISSIAFFIASLLATYCSTVWEIEISLLTVTVVSVGLLGMTVGELIGRKIKVLLGGKNCNQYNKGIIDLPSSFRTITIKKNIRFIFCLLILVCTVLYVFDAYRVGIMNGGSGLNAFAYMKNAYLTGAGSTMNPVIRQFFKVVLSGAYISCFIFTNNCLVNKDNFFKNVPYFIIIVCAVLVTIASGSRTEILRILSAMFFDFLILWRIKKGNNRKVNSRSSKELIKKILPYAIAVVVVAYASRAIVKTANVETSSIDSIIYYVAYYVGSSISVLNTKLNMAFTGADICLGSRVSIPEFVYLGHLNYGGNVATILYTRMYEYGLIVMFLYICIVYVIGGNWYKRLSRIKGLNKNTMWSIILFSNFYYIFVMSYYSDILSDLGAIISNILICVVCYILFKVVMPYTTILIKARE